MGLSSVAVHSEARFKKFLFFKRKLPNLIQPVFKLVLFYA